MADNYILEMENVDKIYGSGDSEVKALNHVSFSVHKGEFIAIIGESGSGKSTLLNIVGMLDRPTNGKIVIDGIEQREMTLDQQAVFRRENIGFIFQSFNLIQELTVEENIIFPISLGHNKPDRKKIDSIINKGRYHRRLTRKYPRLPGDGNDYGGEKHDKTSSNRSFDHYSRVVGGNYRHSRSRIGME